LPKRLGVFRAHFGGAVSSSAAVTIHCGAPSGGIPIGSRRSILNLLTRTGELLDERDIVIR
jgi:hypothetical protein